jgi:predicted AAA+ superfamily ATPase
LAREFVGPASPLYFDLEDPLVAALMDEQPRSVLDPLRGLVVIDEAQRCPGLFPVLRVLADRPGQPAQFMILGSASPSLVRQASESLAGRVEIIEMRGFSLAETGGENAGRLWVRGGFPRSYLSRSDADSIQWRKDFVSTFLERDLGALGFGMSPPAMRRFWTMIAHYHGQIWNGSEVAASLGIAPNTARHYLDALDETFMVRRLQPWHVNLGKRVVKTPKLYFRDSGIFHALQGIGDLPSLLTHPKLGASWEGFALEETLHALQPDGAWFYAVHSGSELDLFLHLRGKRIGVDFKRQDAPRITRSMQISSRDLELDELWIVYPGEREFQLGERVRVRPLASVVLG